MADTQSLLIPTLVRSHRNLDTSLAIENSNRRIDSKDIGFATR